MEVVLADFDGSADASRSEIVATVAAAWLSMHDGLLITPHNLERSLEHLLTRFLGSGPQGRRSPLPAEAGVVLARADVDELVAMVCRSYRKAEPVAGEYAAAFSALALELAPLAAAIQLGRTPCQERAKELLREAGLFQEAGRKGAPVTLTMVKDRVVSVLTPAAVREYLVTPGRSARHYLDRILESHVGPVGATVYLKLVAATTHRLPVATERDVVERFNRLWTTVSSARLLSTAAKIYPADPEDAVQDAAERVLNWLRRHPGAVPPHPAGFLHNVVANAARDARRRAARGPVGAGKEDSSIEDAGYSWLITIDELRTAASTAARWLGASSSADARLGGMALEVVFCGTSDRDDLVGSLARAELRRLLVAVAGREALSAAQARRAAAAALEALDEVWVSR